MDQMSYQQLISALKLAADTLAGDLSQLDEKDRGMVKVECLRMAVRMWEVDQSRAFMSSAEAQADMARQQPGFPPAPRYPRGMTRAPGYPPPQG